MPAVDALGKVKFNEEVLSLSASTVTSLVTKCDPVIVNVRAGTHWVLVTGTTSDPNVFKVNDPYFSSTTYSMSDISEFVVYDVTSSTFRRFNARPQGPEASHQDKTVPPME